MRNAKMSLRVLQLKRLLALSSVVELPSVLPRTVEIRGIRMDMASSVLLNGATADKFAAVSPGQLLVQVPPGVTGAITEVAVLSDYTSPGTSSLAYYDLGNHPWFTSGKYRVLQMFIKLLLTSPGTDVFSMRAGGGLQQLSLSNVDKPSREALAGEIESRVGNVTSQIVQNQTNDPSISQSEHLLKAVVDGITFSIPEQSIGVKISLYFHDGGSLAADFGW